VNCSEKRDKARWGSVSESLHSIRWASSLPWLKQKIDLGAVLGADLVQICIHYAGVLLIAEGSFAYLAGTHQKHRFPGQVRKDAGVKVSLHSTISS